MEKEIKTTRDQHVKLEEVGLACIFPLDTTHLGITDGVLDGRMVHARLLFCFFLLLFFAFF